MEVSSSVSSCLLNISVELYNCNSFTHNYTMCAIRSLILEIEKYPPIYTRMQNYLHNKSLNESYWTRIVNALISETEVDTNRLLYWKHSFKALWKWMTQQLKRDMEERHQLNYKRDNNLDWLNMLKFLEPHIVFSHEDEVEENDCNCEIEVKILCNKLAFQVVDSQIVVWIEGSPGNTTVQCISICFRLKRGVVAPAFSLLTETVGTLPRQPSISIFPSNQLTLSTSYQSGHTFGPSNDTGGLDTKGLLAKLKQLKPKENFQIKAQIIESLHSL